ncbi:MAG: hypothetical protein ABI680_09655 [Chthoniobacteraceae bacterium]
MIAPVLQRLSLLAAIALSMITDLRGGELRVGAAQVVITPPPGTPMAGYYHLRESSEVLDDIYAKALVFEQDDQTAAIVVCDLISLPRHTVVAARKAIESRTGLPGDHVLLAATHAHTGPVIARESSFDDFDGGSTEPAVSYTDALPGLIAESVDRAINRLSPARTLAANTTVENLAFNRRFWMDDGTVSWNPRKLDPGIVAPAGPHDPEVGMLFFETPNRDANVIGAFVNYAMHPDTTGGTRISADFPGVLARRLAEMEGPELVTVFANGACGNLNHRNVWWADPQHGPGETARLGNILAGAVLGAWPSLAPVETSAPRVRSEIVKLPLRELTETDLEEAREVVRRTRANKAQFMEQVKAFRVLDVMARDQKPHEVEVQVIALGPEIAFVSLPGEIFVELGLAIKAASPFKYTFIAELANGSIGYIPNAPAYAEGNYEVVSARCAEGSGELLVEAATRLLRALHAK